MRFSLILVCAAALAAQTITFSPQQPATGKSAGRLTLWAVDVAAPGKTAVASAQIYAIAAAHQVGHVDATLANAILTARAARSPLAIAVKIMGAGSALTAAGSVIKNQGLVTNGIGAQIQNAALVAAGVSAIALPYLQKDQPVVPNPAIAAELLASELKLGAGGSGSALFYSLPSAVGAFVDKLP